MSGEESGFKDLFSTQASDYARYRPHYPLALFRHLAKLSPGLSSCWDCGTGNGQAAVALAAHFQRVIATDPSDKQLAAAVAHERVEYRMTRAETSGLEAASVDLITAAQAFHWFRQESFFEECRRVAKPGALLALWCYGLAEITPAVDSIVALLYEDVLGAYWEKERRLVEDGYSRVSVPFPEIEAPRVAMGAEWMFPDLVGYLGTWSALQKFREERGEDPRSALIPSLQVAWGEISRSRQINWPLSLRIFRVE